MGPIPAAGAGARSRRRRAVLQARLDGRYGPTAWEVLPAFAALAAAVGAPVALLAWLQARLGGGGLVLGLVALAAAAVPLVRWRRATARRRGGLWTAGELAALDDRQLPVAVLTMLRRDGWRVRSAPWRGRPRLVGGHPGLRLRIDVTFRQQTEGNDGPPPPHPGCCAPSTANRRAGRCAWWSTAASSPGPTCAGPATSCSCGPPAGACRIWLGLPAATDETPGDAAATGG